MTVAQPHYLLFAHAERSVARTATSAGHGRWRFVLEDAAGERQAAEDDEYESSVERLELLAIVRGLEALEQPSQVTLHTASRAISRGFREGLELWREDDFQWERYGQMTPIKNADLWRRIDQALAIHQVTIRLTRPAGADDLNAPVPVAAPETLRRPGAPGPGLRVDPPHAPAAVLSPDPAPRRSRTAAKPRRAAGPAPAARGLLGSLTSRLGKLWPWSRAAAD